MTLRILITGASGTMGRATAAELIRRGHDVTAVLRETSSSPELAGLKLCRADLGEPSSLESRVTSAGPFDVMVSCLGSRTGVPRDAWAVDHVANRNVLNAAREAGVHRVVYLSAICVQKPKLAFQFAKLAFEDDVKTSGLEHAIVRPTAFYKSLSGQIERVRAGKPFLVFGDGTLTRCKPISDRDLARFMAECAEGQDERSGVLPIGGTEPAISPLDQADMLSRITGRAVPTKSVPPGFLKTVANALSIPGALIPALRRRAALARIGHYYATESMLLWDRETESYNADATPTYGSDTLYAHYRRLWNGDIETGLGEHAMF